MRDVSYSKNQIEYTATNQLGTEYLRLAFIPKGIIVNGVRLELLKNLDNSGYTLKSLGDGDYALTIKRAKAGKIIIE